MLQEEYTQRQVSWKKRDVLMTGDMKSYGFWAVISHVRVCVCVSSFTSVLRFLIVPLRHSPREV